MIRSSGQQSLVSDSRTHHTDSGFTLIEILGVLIIISLSVFLTTYSLKNATPHYRLQSGERKVQTALRTVRNQAMSSGQFFVVVYRTKQNKIEAYADRGGVNKSEDQTDYERSRSSVRSIKVDEREPTLTFHLPEGVKIDEVERNTSTIADGPARFLVSPVGYFQPHRVVLIGEDDTSVSVLQHPVHSNDPDPSSETSFSQPTDTRTPPEVQDVRTNERNTE